MLHEFCGPSSILVTSPYMDALGYMRRVLDRRLQRGVVHLCWPIAPRNYESKCGGREGVAGSQPMNRAVHITWHGAKINFGDLPPYLTYCSRSAGRWPGLTTSCGSCGTTSPWTTWTRRWPSPPWSPSPSATCLASSPPGFRLRGEPSIPGQTPPPSSPPPPPQPENLIKYSELWRKPSGV